MSSKVDKETFCGSTRYLYEIADYLGVSSRTLKVWIEDIPNVRQRTNWRLFTPKEVRIIIDHLGN